MARFKDRQKAISLRKEGKTYSQIRKELGITKSTLSNWLSKFPLTDEQMKSLRKNQKLSRQIAIEKTRLVKRKKKEARLSSTYEEQVKYWGKLSSRELKIAGLFLYWGEGSKRLNGSIALGNTDPEVMKFTLLWLKRSLNVSVEKIKVDLHLYSDMNIKKEKEFWSNTLQMPLAQFRKPYIKESKRVTIDHKGYGHGTCTLVVNDTRLKEKTIMSIQAIADNCGEKI